MNAYVICFAALVSAAPTTDPWRPVPSPLAAWPAPLVAQVPDYEDFEYEDSSETLQPDPGALQTAPDTFAQPPLVGPDGGYGAPYQTFPQTQFGTPECPQCVPGSPYGGAGPRMYARPGTGPQPYDFGWLFRFDDSLIPKERTSRNNGQFGSTELNFDLQYTTASHGYIYSFTQEFDVRFWEGPNTPAGAAVPTLPGSVYRFGWDLKLATPANNPWSIELGFNPSINSDLQDGLSSDAWNFDSRGILYYRTSPYWTYAIGAGFWDRVDDRVVPYAGVVYTPDDHTEYRILFPESRISRRLGYFFGGEQWIYVRGEYHVEAYEIELERTGAQEKVELEDWRILAGLWEERGHFSKFVEAGWIFGRDVEFLHGTPGFDVSSGFIARGGIRY